MRILSESRIELTPALMNARTFREPVVRPRSKGVHVAAVCKALGVAAGKLTAEDDEDYPFERFSESCYPLLPALGVAWEEFRASHFSLDELIAWPYELERDCLFGTPDGFFPFLHQGELFSGGHWGVQAHWECKLTTKKFKADQPHALHDAWMYLKQGMCYCAMSGLTCVQYDVLWMLGDYTRPYQPVGTSTVVEFDEREIESWWSAVVKAAKDVRPE